MLHATQVVRNANYNLSLVRQITTAPPHQRVGPQHDGIMEGESHHQESWREGDHTTTPSGREGDHTTTASVRDGDPSTSEGGREQGEAQHQGEKNTASSSKTRSKEHPDPRHYWCVKYPGEF